jgi:hypothetical protein
MSLNFNTLRAISSGERCFDEEKNRPDKGSSHVALDLSAVVYAGKMRIRDV